MNDRQIKQVQEKPQEMAVAAAARLVGDLAHELRNQLTIIKGYSELLQRMKIVSGDPGEMLDQIVVAARNAEKITEDLLVFGRGGRMNPRMVDLREQLADLCRDLSGSIDPKIRLSFSSDPNAFRVRVEPEQFRQAVTNLVRNSVEAMPSGGDLRIAIHSMDAKDRDERILTDTPLVAVEVSDTGKGLDSETMAKVSEPFYPNGSESKSSGLSLAAVYDFARHSGGAVEIDNAPGEGATVRILLPLVQGEESA